MPARGLPEGGEGALSTYIQPWIAFAESKYRKRNTRIHEVIERRTRRKEPRIPKAYAKTAFIYKSSMLKDLLRRGQSIIGSELPEPTCIPLKPGPVAAKAAAKKAMWLKEAMVQMDRGINVWGQITDADPADGMAVWKVETRLDEYSPERGYEDENDEAAEGAEGAARKPESTKNYAKRLDTAHKQFFPFVRTHVPSASYYPIAWDSKGVSEVLEITYREAYPLFQQYDLYRESGKKNSIKQRLGEIRSDYPEAQPQDTVRYVEWWNRTHWACFVESVLVDWGEHNTGRPPYFCAQFSPTSMHDPAYDTEGLGDTIIPLQDLEDSFVSSMMSWIMRHGFPALTLKPVGPDVPPVQVQDQVVKLISGEISVPPPGYELVYATPPEMSGDVAQFLTYIVDRMDKVSLSKILFGEAADISGPAASSLIALAHAIFGPAVKDLGRAMDETAAYVLEIIDTVIGSPVPLWLASGGDGSGEWVALGPKDIDGYYRVHYTLAPVIPMERMQKAIFIANAMQLGGVDINYYRTEGLGITDPEDMDVKIRVQEYRKRPEYTGILMEEFQKRVRGRPPGPPPGQGTPANQPVGPGGPGQPQMAAIQQAPLPGMESVAPGAGTNVPPPGTVGPDLRQGAPPAGPPQYA